MSVLYFKIIIINDVFYLFITFSNADVEMAKMRYSEVHGMRLQVAERWITLLKKQLIGNKAVKFTGTICLLILLYRSLIFKK